MLALTDVALGTAGEGMRAGESMSAGGQSVKPLSSLAQALAALLRIRPFICVSPVVFNVSCAFLAAWFGAPVAGTCACLSMPQSHRSPSYSGSRHRVQ